MKRFSLSKARIVVLAMALALARAASAQDFNLTLQPSTVTLIPGQNVSFVVSLAPINGFTSQVTLATGTLPTGVTAQFNPTMVTPPGSSLLQLSAATNAALGSFMLNVIASGGGITNSTTNSVTVDFGLLPLCYGAFQGQVTDIQSGLPVPGATVVAQYSSYYSAVADANGMYIITNVALGSPDNQPLQYNLYANDTGYWQSGNSNAFAVCDATNVVNLQILLKQTGSISGQVLIQGGGPATGVVVSADSYYQYASTNTDATGSFQFPSLQLYPNNASAPYSVSVNPAGYWQSSSNVTVQAGSNTVVTLTLIPICYGTVTGRVIFANSGLPVTNTSVEVEGYNYSSPVTDSNGYYIATNMSLGFDNASVSPYVYASYTGYYEGSTNSGASLTCGATVGMPTLQLQPVPPPPPNIYGSVTGHVYDIQSGLPITNAELYVYSYNVGYEYYADTDTNGAYYITNIWIGTGSTTNGSAEVTAEPQYYFSASSNLTLYADEVVTQDLRLLLIGYGAVAGTVSDSVTMLPIPGAYVYPYGYADTNGHYASGQLQLSSGNAPTIEELYAQANGYWPSPYTNTTITQGVTNIVNIDLIKVCTGATIVGNVVDANTQKPITNATVSVSGYGVYRSDMTDTNGSFILTNVTVGNDNAPFSTTVNASAPGYNPQSKNVTIFCDATINTEFGATETVFGGIDGYVTNVITGLPMTNVFIGSGFGASTTTDTNGYYDFSQVPLGANGASIVWTVTAIPSGFTQITKSVSVSSNTVSRLDFDFGLPPTALVVTAEGTPDPVTVGSNLLYLVTLTNTVADAQEVQLSDTLPPGVTFVSAAFTNSPGTPFNPPAYSNNVVTTAAADFDSNSVVELAIVVTPTVVGTLTNVASVSSSTPDLDPTGSNHTATVITTVVAPAGPTPTALIVSVAGPPNPVTVGSNILFLVTLTNTVANAEEVQLSDTLPSSVTFVSAFLTNSPGTPFSAPIYSDDVVTTTADEFGSNSTVELAILVTSTVTGTVTNVATVSSSTPNLNTNASVLTASTNATVVGSGGSTTTNVAVQAIGPIVFNPQTGLYQQSILATNLGSAAVAAVRVSVLGLPSSITLYNATGSANGSPYVEYDQTVAAGGGVVFLLEYYEASRQTFASPNFVATVVTAAAQSAPTGTVLQLDRPPFMSEGELTIEFASVPGDTYVVQYSTNTTSPQWQTALPPIVATGTKTQWIDSGPPKTDSAPGAPGQRLYQILLVQADPKIQTHLLADPFYLLRGTYYGLIGDTNIIANRTLGSVIAATTKGGTYSAKIQLGGKTFSAGGSFDATGTSARGIERADMPLLLLQLHLDLTGAAGLSGIISDGAWTADIAANKSSSYSASNPCPYAGQYNLLISTNGQNDSVPAGSDFGKVSVDAAGRLIFSGSLPDGTRLTQSSVLSPAGDWPLYASLYDNQGCIAGWVTFTNSPVSAGSGLVIWLKPALLTSTNYPAGFTNQVPIVLLRRSPPISGRGLTQPP